MIKRLLFLVLTVQLAACAELQQLATNALPVPLSAEEAGKGLKEALDKGISDGTEKLSATDGYFKSAYKILLPPEAQKITEKLQVIPGFSQAENVLLEKINRAAEDAAGQAAPIFTNAIRQMTFSDALGILKGADNAATSYLQRTTWQQLYDAFNPVVVRSLDKFNARKYWSDAVTAYNKIPLVEKANPNLDDYITREALVGLFAMVAEKEKGIRTDVSQRTSDLLRRVFAEQD